MQGTMKERMKKPLSVEAICTGKGLLYMLHVDLRLMALSVVLFL